MVPGPDQIIACPKCKGLAKYMTLRSGNTFGASVWTDGKQVAPMLPHPPAVVKCHHCGECYWLAKAKEVGTVEPWGSKDQPVDTAWAASLDVQEPTEEEYYLALERGMAADREQERDLRIFAWWRRNDVFRYALCEPTEGTADASVACRRNLDALRSLSNKFYQNDQIMEAEIQRELGNFDAAVKVLDGITLSEYSAVARQLRSLCESRDIFVRRLDFGE